MKTKNISPSTERILDLVLNVRMTWSPDMVLQRALDLCLWLLGGEAWLFSSRRVVALILMNIVSMNDVFLQEFYVSSIMSC